MVWFPHYFQVIVNVYTEVQKSLDIEIKNSLYYIVLKIFVLLDMFDHHISVVTLQHCTTIYYPYYDLQFTVLFRQGFAMLSLLFIYLLHSNTQVTTLLCVSKHSIFQLLPNVIKLLKSFFNFKQNPVFKGFCAYLLKQNTVCICILQ